MFDAIKSGYLHDDDDDKEYRGIRDLEYSFEEINENDEDYYKPILTKCSFVKGYKYYESRGDKNKTWSVE